LCITNNKPLTIIVIFVRNIFLPLFLQLTNNSRTTLSPKKRYILFSGSGDSDNISEPTITFIYGGYNNSNKPIDRGKIGEIMQKCPIAFYAKKKSCKYHRRVSAVASVGASAFGRGVHRTPAPPPRPSPKAAQRHTQHRRRAVWHTP
jgi:hypothetical protein